MAQHTIGSKINAKRQRSVTTSGAETRQMVEDITGKPYQVPRISFNRTTGLFEEREAQSDPASKTQATLRKRMETEPEARPHISRPASGPPKLGRVIIKSQFVHPDIVAHALTAYWQQRYWYGMMEAARRSQSAPVPLRWETIQVRPTRKSLQLELIQGGLKSLAEKARRPDNLAAAAYIAPTTLLSMQRNPYLGAPTGDALAAHIVLYEVFGYNEVDLLVIYILERLDCWRNPRLQDKEKDYDGDRYYIKPQDLKRRSWSERRAWAVARAQGRALVDEMATWPKWREAA